MISRTVAAFEFSFDKLLNETGELYFWTFTFREVMSDDDCLKAWNKLLQNHRNIWKNYPGIRVIELHKFHGMHFHVLFNKRVPIREMLRVGEPLGFGRISCEKVKDPTGTKRYLRKYLRKDFMKDQWRKGRRRWAGINGFQNTRCKDIEYDGPYQRNKRLFYGSRSVSGQWQNARFLMGCSEFGDFADWPDRIKEAWLRRFRELAPLTKRKDSGLEQIL